MSIDTAREVMSAIAAAGNIILFASQIPLVWRLATVDKDSSRYDWLPSLTLMTTMSLWCGYTVWVLPTTQLFAANFPGVGLPLCYLAAFAVFERKDQRRRLRIIAATLLALAATWGFSAGVYGSGSVANATSVGGGVTAAVNCSFFVSPLRQLRRAARELDLSRTPTLLSFVQFWQSVAWVAAAVLLDDMFILGVNAVGLSFACLQLAVIAYVRRRRAQLGLKPGQAAPWVLPAAAAAAAQEEERGRDGAEAAAKVAPSPRAVVVDESAASGAEGGKGREEGEGV
jgi:hypothetical protein